MKHVGTDIKAILIASLYLLAYLIFLNFESTYIVSVVMLFISPVVVIWMVYTVIRHGEYNGPELGKNEFGYADKKKEELGVF